VVIFSILLISNLSVYLSSLDRQRMYSESYAEASLSDRVLVLAGEGAMQLLSRLQTFLMAGPIPCDSAASVLGKQVEGISYVARSDGASVSVSARLAPDATASDNMTILRPFQGFVSGDLNVALVLIESGSVPSRVVSFQKVETHLAHLPFHVGQAASTCERVTRAFYDAASVPVRSNCTASDAASVLSSALRGLGLQASSPGLTVSYLLSTTSGASCAVEFVVGVDQVGVDGPGGPFTVRLEESGSFLFAVPSVPQQA
jgi:hypothetical protein